MPQIYAALFAFIGWAIPQADARALLPHTRPQVDLPHLALRAARRQSLRGADLPARTGRPHRSRAHPHRRDRSQGSSVASLNASRLALDLGTSTGCNRLTREAWEPPGSSFAADGARYMVTVTDIAGNVAEIV